ncbi:MAG: membrane protein insertase YidC [Chlamydiota bacterium]|nr:membrane protein insertase YidC [Chlamydiota bacterium]
MDKRTLIFVISLSLSLFLINTFFEYQNQETRKQWTEQQVVKKRQKIKQLESYIEEKSAKPESLPLIKIYSDANTNTLLNTGISVENNILTLGWSDNLPQTIYANQNGKTEKYELVSQAKGNNTPAIYSKDPSSPLEIGYLADFGQYDLQAITLFPESETQPYSITPAEYTDGHFTLPAEEIYELKSEIAKQGEEPQEIPHENSLILMKTNGKYLPIGAYIEKDKRLLYLKEVPSINTTTVKPSRKKLVNNGEKSPETFYVLENEYQQLVFSSYGGAIAEINLPFQSESNEKSVVKEIQFDREMVKNHPYNAEFPAHPYFTPGNTPEGPFNEHEEGTLGGYYPLIRRDLIETGNRKSVKIPPKYYSLNVVSEYPELAEVEFEVKYFDKNKIVFESTQEHRRITKTYSLDTDIAPYAINLTIKVEGDSRGLWLTSGVPEAELISGSSAPALKYRITRGDTNEVKLIDLPTDTTTITSSTPDWICDSNGFFGIIMDSLSGVDAGYRAEYVSGSTVPTRLIEIDQDHERFPESKFPGYQMLLPLWSKGGTMNFRIFAGPFSTEILKKVDAAYSDSATGYNPDYIACQSFHGWFSFISEPFAKFLMLLMNFFHSITGSWGFSIILLTVALRLMLYPLNAWSTKSMLRTQQMMPKIQAIQNKYKNDPKRAQLEVLNFYREQGVNPLSGLTGGCFPLLIQMPFLIGMFDLLKSSFQLRGAAFVPGWINDLASPDVLFSWNTPIPLIGNEFHLLPILLGMIMFFQPRFMSPLPKDKNEWSEQQRQQRTMGNMMAVMFTWLFYSFPSGLNIYWASSMLLGMLQQWWNKRNITAPAEAVLIDPKKGKSSSRTKKKNTRS